MSRLAGEISTYASANAAASSVGASRRGSTRWLIAPAARRRARPAPAGPATANGRRRRARPCRRADAPRSGRRGPGAATDRDLPTRPAPGRGAPRAAPRAPSPGCARCRRRIARWVPWSNCSHTAASRSSGQAASVDRPPPQRPREPPAGDRAHQQLARQRATPPPCRSAATRSRRAAAPAAAARAARPGPDGAAANTAPTAAPQLVRDQPDPLDLEPVEQLVDERGEPVERVVEVTALAGSAEPDQVRRDPPVSSRNGIQSSELVGIPCRYSGGSSAPGALR